MSNIFLKALHAITPPIIVNFRNYIIERHSKSFFFDVHLTDHCNLNCVSCEVFSPIAEKYFLSVDAYEKDCKRFSELAGKYISAIFLLGGEPLLHPQIIDIIKITRKYFSLAPKIEIITNGILLDKQDEQFWKCCKENNISIAISPYMVNLDMKKIGEWAIKYNLSLKYCFAYKKEIITSFLKRVINENGNADPKKNFVNCVINPCHQLRDGKFYMCPLPAYINIFNKYFKKDFKVVPADFIDIYQAKSGKQILKYIRKPIPFCRYCANCESHNFIPWGPSKKDISEWTNSNIKLSQSTDN